MAGPVPFVGRGGELSRLLEAVGGSARLVLVVGDAGVGKTRFTGEAMARAAAAGMVMVRGECLPLAETVPLLPVAGALGALARVDDGGVVAAALNAVPGYVREEVARLVPGLARPGKPGPDGRDDGWRRGRLFSAVAELLDAVAGCGGRGVGVVVEDVHWADSATLDCLTFLMRGGCRGAVGVVVTCRGDEAPLTGHVAEWLAQVRGAVGVEEIRLGPLSRPEVAGLVAALAGGPVPQGVAEELYARAEGNPFFTEQLVAAVLAGPAADRPGVPAGIPGRLAELLVARAGRCAGDARAVLAGLAVAGRPLDEDLLGEVTGLTTEAVREGLRELAAVRLLAEDSAAGGHRPRHALLAEAVADDLLPSERALLHERMARALAAAGDESLAAEVAEHWRAAGDPAEELPARVAAAKAAERVFGYAEAAAHWEQAIELCQTQPGAAAAAGVDLPRAYVQAIDALYLSGDGERASGVAEEAYRRFAGHPDPATAAIACHRAAFHRAIDSPGTGFSLMEEALRRYEQAPPSADQARAWLDYADDFLYAIEGRHEGIAPALNRALQIAEAAGATVLLPRILAQIAEDAFRRGQVDEGFALVERALALARAADEDRTLMQLAVTESDALLKLARFPSAAEAAFRGLDLARQVGLGASFSASFLAGNAAEALLAGGRTAEAAALIDPLTTGPPDRLHWMVHEARAEIDLLRGDIAAAVGRRQQIDALFADVRQAEFARESAQRAADLASWAGCPGDAVAEVHRVLPLFKSPYLAVFCGRLLAAGMRACADLAEQARARRDEPAAEIAAAAAESLDSWTGQMGGAPFTDHPFVASIPAERATWDAERTRLAGASNPAAWSAAAKAWHGLGCPHRAGYAWWRQAQAHLEAGQPATTAAAELRAAAAAADGHAPLLAQVRLLAERARIPLQPPTAVVTEAPIPAQGRAPYGLTGRELAVLRLLAAGRTNAQIGAELYISPSTASVHVSSILRKLGVSSRVQAAAIAERAGLLHQGQS
jgi:DNA-binding CsgD family transcriptional regulator/tetratricopeptide (TPR) repeat protein